MRNLTALLIGSGIAICGSAFASDIHEGQWRYTTTMEGMAIAPEMKNFDMSKLPPEVRARMPQFNGKTMTMNFEHCVTNADLVPHEKDKEHDCKITRMDRHGNTVEWASVCDTPHGKMNGEGTATYETDSMTATTHLSGTGPDGKPIKLTQRTTGKYLGACPAK